MPAYAAHAAAMSDGMARWHGVNPQEKSQLPAFKVDPALAKTGEELLSSEKGFGCTTCHGLRETGPTAAFEVQGISLELIGSRLRHEWYHRWMDNPASITPGTKMPQYAPAGKSPNPAFQNDARQQFEAIWHFLQSQKNR
jgi:cbb3-type cytochrome oxidase cytochrome c subunit